MLVYPSIERDICKKHKNEKQTQEQGVKRENRTAVALEGKIMRMWATRGGILSGALAYKTLCSPQGSPQGAWDGSGAGVKTIFDSDQLRNSDLNHKMKWHNFSVTEWLLNFITHKIFKHVSKKIFQCQNNQFYPALLLKLPVCVCV